MANFNFGTLETATRFRFCCTGPGGTTYTDPFTVDPACTAACQVLTQPQSVSGETGDTVSLGGTATGSFSWQTASSVNGPWSAATEPTVLTAALDGTFWRFCCDSEPTVCSNTVSITVTDTPTCQVTAQPSGVNGAVGDPISFGGAASGAVQWETAGNAGGPWTPATPPATITAANIGTFWRFCCLDDNSVCSVAVTITDSATGAAMTRSDADGTWDTAGPDDPVEQFCMNNCAGAITWWYRVDDPVDPPAGWVDNQGWQQLTGFDGQLCFELTAPNAANVIAQDPSAFDPLTVTGETDLDHDYTFYVQGRCDGVVIDTFTVIVPYDHIDEGIIP